MLKNTYWFYSQWEPNYIKSCEPSIEYLELYAVLVGLYLWGPAHFKNKKIIIYCDNMAVVGMVNKTSSSCKHCMHPLILLVVNGLKHNFRVYAVYVNTKQNMLTDSLSRLKISNFKKYVADSMQDKPEMLPTELWLVSKLWGATFVKKISWCNQFE